MFVKKYDPIYIGGSSDSIYINSFVTVKPATEISLSLGT